MKKLYLLMTLLLLMLPSTVQAQTTPPQIAFVNPSGQLVVAGADGITRWIVTNPGERLHPTLGYTWSTDSATLFFAVENNDTVSLRMGDVASQQVTEISRVQEPVSGGEWLNEAVAIASANQSRFYSVSGAVDDARNALFRADAPLTLHSPFVSDQPYLQTPQAIAPDGNALFGVLPDSTYAVQDTAGNTIPLRVRNTPDARKSGLWQVADNAPLLAYHGTAPNGTSALGVVNPQTGEIVELTSEFSVPMLPVLWLPDSTRLVYRDGSGQVLVTDMACLLTGCADVNPLEQGVSLLPASAEDVQVAGDYVYYRAAGSVYAQSLSCIADNTCATTAIPLAAQVAPRTILHVVDSTLIYTAYLNDPANPADREIRLLDTNCLPDNCTPQPLVSGAIAGMLSGNAAYLVMDIIGDGRYALRLADMNRVYLSDTVSNGTEADLLHTRWNN